jgi:cytochrome c oxidase subunit IV
MQRPPAVLVWSWAGLLALLALTVGLAYQPLGSLNTAVALTIAAIKVVIIAAIFMELREGRPLVLGFALAGLLWLFIMFWLASIDFRSRPGFPPPQQVGDATVGDATVREAAQCRSMPPLHLGQPTECRLALADVFAPDL